MAAVWRGRGGGMLGGGNALLATKLQVGSSAAMAPKRGSTRRPPCALEGSSVLVILSYTAPCPVPRASPAHSAVLQL